MTAFTILGGGKYMKKNVILFLLSMSFSFGIYAQTIVLENKTPPVTMDNSQINKDDRVTKNPPKPTPSKVKQNVNRGASVLNLQPGMNAF